MIPINALQLTEYLSNNSDAVLDILGYLDCTNISYDRNKQTFRFARAEGRNPSSVIMNVNTLSYYCFSTNSKGNLYTLVMAYENLSFPQSLDWVVQKLGLEKAQFSSEIKFPFGGFYKNLVKEINEPEYSMTTYDEDILEEYLYKHNMMFFNDGINFQSQEKFKVGFDLYTLRISVPEYTLDGKLCGIMGRSIDNDCPKEERWLPIIPCSRSLTLYGYHTNYAKIQEKGLAILGESEKLPQQLDSIGIKTGLSTCGCHISDTQAKYIKSLLIPKTILAYDEGLEEEFIREEAKKIKISNQVFSNSIGYIFDDDNSVLEKGKKQSPTDLGKEKFVELIKNKVRWI